MTRKAKYKAVHNNETIMQNLATKAQTSTTTKITQRKDGYVGKVVPKAVSRTRADISSWKGALRSADSIDNPRRARLYNLYEDILLDAHLTAQIELRMQSVLSTPFSLKLNGVDAPDQTEMLRSARWKSVLDRYVLWSIFFGNSLVELTTTPLGELSVGLLPRNNIVPDRGLFLFSEDDTSGVKYRELREYGTWILEFGQPKDYGLLNKAVPHVLFMRFAQSCWSELCEIYGIPPRVIKTNTQDPEMLDRAEAMMRDMGSAAYFIIDDSESFEFAKGADTNGDVYRNLMSVCKEALSVLINGAVLGQDTTNGNRSKEESSLKLMEKIVMSDKRLLEDSWNGIILPALIRIGVFPEGITLELQKEEDIEKLWKQTHEALQFFDVDPEWIKTKFGIEVTAPKQQTQKTQLRLSADSFFE